MAEHHATITWQGAATAEDFRRGKYSREHTWAFDGGMTVAASPSPSVVPAPWSNPAHVDPEEAFVASVSSCHMLTFLYLAAKQGFVLTSYRDAAVGVMTKGENGVPWISKITLHPALVFGDKQPTAEELAALHHHSHEQCFIASSIKTEVVVAP
ncbi:MAG: OsmC family protein [Polyangiales bacterium]